MNNITLGKVLKAMYKLSGKTIVQLSEETGLTVDTINNLFYARIQKPGLSGVNAMVNAMGFTIQQLMTFLDMNPELPDECDVTELFTQYITSAADTKTIAAAAIVPVKTAKGKLSDEIELLNEEHEKQLDRFRDAHQRYSEQLQQQSNQQIEQMKAHNQQLEDHFDKSIVMLKETHANELNRIEAENTRLRRTGKLLAIAVGIETGLIIILLVMDIINRSVGWFR